MQYARVIFQRKDYIWGINVHCLDSAAQDLNTVLPLGFNTKTR